jgi:hypothetical protein
MIEKNIALETTREMIYSGKPFTFDELQQRIINRNGILRIALGYTVGRYICDLEEDKIIYFNPKIEKFELSKN